MNLSMYTAYARGLDRDNPVRIFRHFYEKGVRFGDIIDDELNEIGLSDYCKNLKDAGIIPDAVVVTKNIVTGESAVKKIEETFKVIDAMQEQGMSVLMIAPSVNVAKTPEDFLFLREKLISSLIKVIDYTKGTSIKVAIENQSAIFRPDSKILDVRYLLDRIPDLKFVLDSGNFYCVGENVMDAYDVLKDRMIRSHIKDWRLNSKGSICQSQTCIEGCAVGDGILPIDKLLSAYKKDGFDGNLVLEVNACEITLDLLDRSCIYLSKITESL